MNWNYPSNEDKHNKNGKTLTETILMWNEELWIFFSQAYQGEE